jgi:hypothetical protein
MIVIFKSLKSKIYNKIRESILTGKNYNEIGYDGKDIKEDEEGLQKIDPLPLVSSLISLLSSS